MVNRSTPPFLFSACLLVGHCGHMRRVTPPPFVANAAHVGLNPAPHSVISWLQPTSLKHSCHGQSRTTKWFGNSLRS